MEVSYKQKSGQYQLALAHTLYPPLPTHTHTCWDTQISSSPKIDGLLQTLVHVSSSGLGQGPLLVQHKQDFYRHVYEQDVQVSLAEVNPTGAGRGGLGGGGSAKD